MVQQLARTTVWKLQGLLLTASVTNVCQVSVEQLPNPVHSAFWTGLIPKSRRDVFVG